MILTGIAFYLFAAVTVAAATMVVSSRNPVHSVLFLILAFFSSAALFLILGAEFVALILVIVYVGAVAVLFLFVVMMLDVDFVQLRQGFLQYLPIGALIGLILMVELILAVATWQAAPAAGEGAGGLAAPAQPIPEGITNTEAIGRVLYTDYVLLFQSAGMLLLVAMIGAIVLTLRHREGVKRQSIADQVNRKREEGVELVKVEPGQGL